MKLRLGIAWIGAGRWGRNLVRVFSEVPEVDPVVVCDHDSGALARLIHSGFRGRTSVHLADVLDDTRVDAVIVATPPSSHVEMALTCLAAGKHVFVEKPLALTTLGALAIERAAGTAGLRVMVGHVLLFHSLVRQLHALIRSGELGSVRHVSSRRMTCSPRDEDAWWTLGAHEVSMLGYLLDASPDSVVVRPSADPPHKPGDAVRARLMFQQTTAEVALSCVHPARERRLVVKGSRKTAILTDHRASGTLRLVDGRLGTESLVGSFDAASYPEPLRLEAEHFVTAIASGGPIISDGAHGVAVVDVLERGGESLALGGELVLIDDLRAGASSFLQPEAPR